MVKIMKVAQDATGEPQPVGQTVKKQIVLQDLEGYSKDDRRIGAVVAKEQTLQFCYFHSVFSYKTRIYGKAVEWQNKWL